MGDAVAPRTTLRVLVWNLQWRRPRGPQEELIRRIDPDVAILTETAGTGYLEGGHWVESEADYGYSAPAYRRKVRIWSRWPWTEVDPVGHPVLPGGRYVAGTSDTPVGPVRIVGVCIPWRDAHVRSGGKDRAAWEDHLRFLDGLRELLVDASRPLLLGGDWNQRIPRKWQPKRVFEALMQTLPRDLNVTTSGKVAGLDRLLIDHLALTTALTSHRVQGVSREGADGPLSDHDGVVVEVGRATV